MGEVSPQRRYLRGVLSVSEIAARRGVWRPEAGIAAAQIRAAPLCLAAFVTGGNAVEQRDSNTGRYIDFWRKTPWIVLMCVEMTERVGWLLNPRGVCKIAAS